MLASKIKLISIFSFILILLSACGHPIPEASVDLAKQKKSLLILSSPALNTVLHTQLKQTLNSWKQTELIAYEWLNQVEIIDELLISKINKTAYSYIMVISKDLKPSALIAAADTPNKRWIVLSDATHLEPASTGVLDNIALYQLNEAELNTMWSQKVSKNLQLTQNQLSNSVSSITYGIINDPIIPTIDFRKAGSVVLIWEIILADQLKAIQIDSFEPGIHDYSALQFRIND